MATSTDNLKNDKRNSWIGDKFHENGFPYSEGFAGILKRPDVGQNGADGNDVGSDNGANNVGSAGVVSNVIRDGVTTPGQQGIKSYADRARANARSNEDLPLANYFIFAVLYLIHNVHNTSAATATTNFLKSLDIKSIAHIKRYSFKCDIDCDVAILREVAQKYLVIDKSEISTPTSGATSPSSPETVYKKISVSNDEVTLNEYHYEDWDKNMLPGSMLIALLQNVKGKKMLNILDSKDNKYKYSIEKYSGEYVFSDEEALKISSVLDKCLDNVQQLHYEDPNSVDIDALIFGLIGIASKLGPAIQLVFMKSRHYQDLDSIALPYMHILVIHYAKYMDENTTLSLEYLYKIPRQQRTSWVNHKYMDQLINIAMINLQDAPPIVFMRCVGILFYDEIPQYEKPVVDINMAHMALRVDEHHIQRMDTFNHKYIGLCTVLLTELLNSNFNENWKFCLTGSLATNFLTQYSDGDIAADTYDDNEQHLKRAHKMLKKVIKTSSFIKQCTYVRHAKVPIVCVTVPSPYDYYEKFGDDTTWLDQNFSKNVRYGTDDGNKDVPQAVGIEDITIDISLGRSSVINSLLLRLYSTWHKNVEAAVIAIKTFFHKCGYMQKGQFYNSFCVTLMVIFAMQHYDEPFKIPVLHSKQLLKLQKKQDKELNFFIPKNEKWDQKQREMVMDTLDLERIGFKTNGKQDFIINNEDYWIYAICNFYANKFAWQEYYLDIRAPAGSFELLKRSRQQCGRTNIGQCLCEMIQGYVHPTSNFMSKAKDDLIIQDPVLQSKTFKCRDTSNGTWFDIYGKIVAECEHIKDKYRSYYDMACQ